MSQISLHAEGISDVTIIPNIFIDQFMPSANGAYVKVYLYLLRCYSGNFTELSVSSIADRLENTEKDILRALNYWEKMNILRLTRNSQKEITSIHLMDLHTMSNKPQQLPDFDSELDEIAVSIHTDSKPASRKSYSAERIAQLTNNDEIKWAMHIVEIYLDRPLKPMDLQLILYLYEELHFSAELIMYLYEYCVSKGKKNAAYIEAVALTWAEEGIDTEEKAKTATASYNDHFNTVNRAFGLNRAPGQIERQYITKWVEVFGFSDEIIKEACDRTILRTQKPDFKYTDKILETWFKKDVKSTADIARLDEEFSKGSKNQNNKVTPMSKPATNKFNQFPQRTYTAQDYEELERKLLNKGF
ncbi:DnaD domain protein [Lachnospiraceae bacterium MD1]|uniref:DnaD domain protein n=1 Tax=Variimorphobacter saccharofermentans TaxID=2755051 RepID=A0A839JXP6_9FIRM|nr:DnaD domain protein [Variimorphobacter saccharofermentans]MBB2181399.1 DnaD domain protein [Variimorphobacter saccharofermentans]